MDKHIDILRRAKEIANRQGRLASSPAEQLSDGSLVLCAASCIAKAAIELDNRLLLPEDFDQRILHSDKSEFIPTVFDACGLDAARALTVMIQNDNQEPTERLSWFNALQSL